MNYEEKVASLIRPDLSLVIHETSGSRRYFLDGRRVLNPDEPIGEWRMSGKVSPSWLKRSAGGWTSFYVPHNIDVAERVLRSMHTCGLIFSNQRANAAYPFGCVWVRLNDGNEDSWARRGVIGSYGEEIPVKYEAFIGDAYYQDGAKFHTSASRYVQYHEPHTVALKVEWLRPLTKRLKAFCKMRRPIEDNPDPALTYYGWSK